MRPLPRIVTISLGVLLLYSCSRNILQRRERVYQAPRIGAEHRFDEGLKREKHPQQLFSKKERQDMEKMGAITEQERSAPNTKISPMQADSILTGKIDTTKAKTDSTGAIPADSTQSQPQPQPKPQSQPQPKSQPSDTTHH